MAGLQFYWLGFIQPCKIYRLFNVEKLLNYNQSNHGSRWWQEMKAPKITQQMQDIIPYMFDCWDDPVVHLLLLKSSILQQIIVISAPWPINLRTVHALCCFLSKMIRFLTSHYLVEVFSDQQFDKISEFRTSLGNYLGKQLHRMQESSYVIEFQS